MVAAEQPTLLIENAAELLTCAAGAADRVGLVPGGSLLIAGEQVVAAGPSAEVARNVDRAGLRVIDARGRVVMPGFVDSHTHLVFGGSRVQEYAARVAGEDLDALRAAGAPVGITGTMRETRALSVEELAAQALPRLREMLSMGITTVESKSGYGLTTESELRLLEANRLLAASQPVEIVSTFMGAHAFPPGVPREAYVETVVREMLPAVAGAGLAEFCDVFCEDGYFSVEETRRILEAGLTHGLRPKLHLDQYEHSGAAGLAADLGCVSVDHLNYTRPDEIRVLAEAGVVGVVMPGIDFAVAHPRPVPAATLLAGGMIPALATDMCPGGWLTNMQFVITLACRLHGFSVAEAIRAATLGGAQALARADRVGSLEPGKRADVLLLDIERHEDLAYRLGRNAVTTVIKGGQVVVERGSDAGD